MGAGGRRLLPPFPGKGEGGVFSGADRAPVPAGFPPSGFGEALFRQELEEAAQAARPGPSLSGEALPPARPNTRLRAGPYQATASRTGRPTPPLTGWQTAALPALTPLLEALEQRRREGKRTLLALEGNAAGGKTTAAGLLAELYGAPVIHMDSFFLPPALRTPQRYAQPGGNIHYERFLPEAAVPLQEGAALLLPAV